MADLITPKAKSEIIKITSFLSSYFYKDNQTDLLAICEDEGISICLDNYENYFDGMLVWDNKNFHIHLNTFQGNTTETKKGRYTLAHELGHYFIDSHREGIKSGALPTHPSNSALVHLDKMEAEADYFAACLLMPIHRLKNFTGRRKFSLDIIKQVSDAFGVSLTAAALRFAEVGTHDIMVVFGANNKAKWYSRSPGFPALANRFKVHGDLPPTTVIGESFLKGNSKYESVELIDLEDWFYDRAGAPTWQLYEQCFYADIHNYVISLVWFE